MQPSNGSEIDVHSLAAAHAAKNWCSEAGEDAPPWDYEIQTYDDLLEAVEEYKKRVDSCVTNRGGDYLKPRLTVIGIEGTSGEVQ
jgi:hypothetical protein